MSPLMFVLPLLLLSIHGDDASNDNDHPFYRNVGCFEAVVTASQRNDPTTTTSTSGPYERPRNILDPYYDDPRHVQEPLDDENRRQRVRSYFNLGDGGRFRLRIGEEFVDASRHHIIPYARLRDFWNTVVDRGQTQARELPSFGRLLLRLVNHAASLYRVNAVNRGTRLRFTNYVLAWEFDAARAVITNRFENRQLWSTTQPITDNEAHGLRILQTVFLWMPGNIFIGPTPELRADEYVEPCLEPGSTGSTSHRISAFEDFAERIVGRDVLQALRNINNMISDYISGRGLIDNVVRQLENFPNNIVYVTDQRYWHQHMSVEWQRGPNNVPAGVPVENPNGPRLFSITWDDENIDVNSVPYVFASSICPGRRQKRDLQQEKVYSYRAPLTSSFPDPYCLISQHLNRTDKAFSNVIPPQSVSTTETTTMTTKSCGWWRSCSAVVHDELKKRKK